MATFLNATNSTNIPWDSKDRQYILKNTVNFSTLAGGGAIQADIVECLAIPAGTFVHRIIAKVTTVEGAALTAKVGDTVTDGWLTALNLNSATVQDASGVHGATGGILYTADTKIKATMLDVGTVNVAVVEFYAICIDLHFAGLFT